MKLPEKMKKGISAQLTYLIVIGIIVAGVLTYFFQYTFSRRRVIADTGIRAEESALELISTLREYPAYEWLLSYWYEHADQLEVEYDTDFDSGTVTEEKERIFAERQPDLSFRYLDQEEIASLPDEDQKLYAEIAYSWILARINESKRNQGCDYLYLTETGTDTSERPYETQCFLMSGADPDAVRGTNYGEVYTLGVTVSVGEDSTSESMRNAVEMALEDQPDSHKVSGESLAGAGNYVDYYACVAVIGDHAYLAGVTYNIKSLLSKIRMDALKSTLLAALYQILLLWIVMQRVSMYIIIPLKKILKIIRSYTHTRDSDAVEEGMTDVLAGKKGMAVRQNEIGQLAEDFTALTKEIDEYTEEIRTVTSQKERYKTELNIASQIQAQVLPKDFFTISENHAFELYASMTPAREVGGDFYDFFFTDQEHLALVIGDVSDKGVPAALFMMTAQALIRNLAKMEKSPAKVLSRVNDQLCENNDSGYFATVWLALIDLTTGEGISVNAGHEYPAVCRAGGSYELIRSKHSISIGVMPGIRYREHAFRLDPGDQLFVYTDGVPEAVNQEEEPFGTERMLDVLNRNRDAGSKELLVRVKEEIDAFAGDIPQFDDTTMLGFRYNGTDQGTEA